MEWKGRSRGAARTRALGAWLGQRAWPGLCIALQGPLGAGKTCFVQGLARGLEVPETIAVCSPTYTLINPYPGRLTLQHLDFYRLGDIDELEVLGWEALLKEPQVVVVEWAERFPEAFPGDHLTVEIAPRSPRIREIRMQSSAASPSMEALFAALSSEQPLSSSFSMSAERLRNASRSK